MRPVLTIILAILMPVGLGLTARMVSADAEPAPVPRVALYATITEAIEARDLYGALDVLPAAPASEGEAPANEPAAGFQAVLDSARWGCPQILWSLMQSGQRIYEPGYVQSTALHQAAAAGHLYTMDLLIRNSAGTMEFDAEGFLPAHVAARGGHTAAIEELRHYGADLTRLSKEKGGRQPQFVALDAGQFGVTHLLRQLGQEADVFFYASAGDLEGIRSEVRNSPQALEQEDGVRNTPLFNCIKLGRRDSVETLLQLGAMLDAVNIEGRSAISVAIQYHQESLIPLLVEAGGNLFAIRDDYFQNSLMHDAVDEGRVETIELLAGLGAPADRKDRLGRTPLHHAFQMKDAAKAEALQKLGADVLCQDAEGKSLLHTAVESQSGMMLNLALKYGAKVNTWDVRRQTPVHYACAKGYNNILELLINQKALLNTRDIDGLTPIMLAAREGQTSIVRWLASLPLDLETGDNNGATALHHAVMGGQEESVRVLLEAGVNANALDYLKRPPVYFALQDGRGPIARLLAAKGADMTLRLADGRSLLYVPLHEETPDLVPWLLDEIHLPAKDADSNHWTVLHQAARVGEEFTIHKLLQAGADPNALDTEGKSPLHIAAIRGHILVLKALVTGGGDENLADKTGWLPLHYAANYGHWGPIQFFMIRGAEVDTPTPEGKTPLQLSVENGMVRTAMLLVGKGADLLHLDAEERTPLKALEALPIIIPREEARTREITEDEMSFELTHNYLRLAYCELMEACLRDEAYEKMGRLIALHPEFINMSFQGWTWLQRAVQAGKPQAVQILLAAGASPKGTDETGLGQTALHLAAAENAKDIATMLLEAAPDLAAQVDLAGKTPAEVATDSGHSELAAALTH